MRKVIRVSNIDCARCAATIESHFNSQAGIEAVVIVPSKKVIFEYDDSKWDLEQITAQLRKIGYQPILSSNEAQKAKKRDLIDMLIAIVFTLPLLWTMFAHFNLPQVVPTVFMNGFFQLTLATIVLFVPGRRFFINTFNQIRNRNLGMDTLVILGTVSAYIYSTYLAFTHIGHDQSHIHYFYEATGTIISMVLIGNVIENRVKEKTSSTLESLMSLESKEATILISNKELIVPIDQVKIGDIIVVKANEYIPLDGIIVNGETYIDEQTMTGESMPRKKGILEKVFAATTNILETIQIEVTANPEDTQLAKIIKTVEDTAKIKPKAQRIADKIASIFVPIVFLIAIITFLIWFFIIKQGNNTGEWLDKAISAAISVLVISCPCALGLATPTSISVASGMAFKNNILFKSGEYFEVSPKITAICFDKTGTLTKGSPVVTDFFGGNETLKITASIEKHSNHPLANAVLEYYNSNDYFDISNFKVEIGSGLRGFINEKEVIIGSKKLLDKLTIENPFPEYDELIADGKTVFFTVLEQRVINMIALNDSLNDHAKEVVLELKRRNIKTNLLTGDNMVAAKKLQESLGIDYVFYELLPIEKAKIIKDLQAQKEIVAFVGDGVNDSLALKIADVSFSVKNANDIALDSSDVNFMNNDLTLVIKAIDLSKKTLINIYQNFFWAFIYNIVMIPLAATGILNPVLSGIGMGFSSIMVVLNALRLKLYKFKNDYYLGGTNENKSN